MIVVRRRHVDAGLSSAAMARRRSSGLLLVASVVVLGACSSGSSSAELTVPESVAVPTETPAVTSAEVTVAETTPSTPPPTEAPEATEAPTTTGEPAPETTEAPPETSAELTIEEQINRDLALGEEALAILEGDPGSAAARIEVESFFGGKVLASILSTADELLAQGWIGKVNQETPSFTELVSDAEIIGNDATQANALICRVDSAILVEPGGDDGINDFIINASITRYVFRTRLERTDGTWKRIENLEDISETLGAVQCDG